jgi:hypothetical protein
MLLVLRPATFFFFLVILGPTIQSNTSENGSSNSLEQLEIEKAVPQRNRRGSKVKEHESITFSEAV